MALDADIIWECRSAGSTNGGGGFDPTVASPGTDYSQQDSPQITYTDLVIDGADSTKVTSAGNPFTSLHPGNIVNVTGGTGFTVGRYRVDSVAGSVATLDRSVGTTGSTGGTGYLGGAYSDPSLLAAIIVHGSHVYLKGSFTQTSTSSATAGGRLLNTVTSAEYDTITIWEGYSTTRGDHGMVTITASGIDSYNMVQSTGVGVEFRNIKCVATGRTGVYGFYASAVINCYAVNCEAVGCDTAGFWWRGLRTALYHCRADSCRLGFNYNCAYFCWSRNTTGGHGFQAGDEGETVFCISDTAAWHGFHCDYGMQTYVNCIAYASSGGSSGFRMGDTFRGTYINCVSVSNAAYGFNNPWAVGGRSQQMRLINCATYNNTSGATNLIATNMQSDMIVLTADPFVDAANSDFTLNDTSGGGQALRSVGWPTTFFGLGNQLDLGAYGMGVRTADITAIADAVLDELLSGHTTAGSLGKAIADIEVDAAAVEVDTQDIQSRLPAALVSGRIDSSVGAVAAGAITAAAIATDAIDADALATDAVTEIKNAVADQVWDEAAAGHVGAGSFGDYMDAMNGGITSLVGRVGAWTGTGVNTILGAFKALLSKVATLPTDIGGTFDPTTDSTEAIRDHVGDGTNLTEAGGTGDHLTGIASVGAVAGAVGSVTGSVGSLGAQAKLDVNAEADTALSDYGALKPTVAGRTLDVTLTGEAGVDLDNTAGTLAKGTDLTGFNDLDAAGVRSAVGMAAANLDTQLDAIQTTLDTDGVQIEATQQTSLQNGTADAVWNEAVSGHVTAGTFGRLLQGIRAGTAQAGAASTITLDASASATNDLYNDLWVEILSGTGAGQARRITDYDGSTKIATVHTPWTTNPSSDSGFVLRVNARQALDLKQDTSEGAPHTADQVGYALNVIQDILAQTDLIPLNPAETGDAMTLTAGERDAVAAALLDLANGIETSYTLRQAIRAIAAATAGEASGMETASGTFKALGNNGTTRITGTMDADGNRSSISLSL